MVTDFHARHAFADGFDNRTGFVACQLTWVRNQRISDVIGPLLAAETALYMSTAEQAAFPPATEGSGFSVSTPCHTAPQHEKRRLAAGY